MLEKLESRDWFIEAADAFFAQVAFNWDCQVVMSERRLGDAWELWADDAAKTKEFGFRIKADSNALEKAEGAAAVRLDHFKVGSIIAFWLRRACPINETLLLPVAQFTGAKTKDSFVEADIDAFVGEATDDQNHFIDYGNELCSILVGFYIILVGEIQLYEQQNLQSGVRISKKRRKSILSNTKLPENFIYEYPKLLKAKNISWHSMFMMYHSLFDNIDLPSLAVGRAAPSST